MESVGIEETIDLLMRRVDTVPESLVLIQAAKESGWGQSRFAREGNALFGQRCYRQGCGLVPGSRASKASFEVESFDTVGESVQSYIRNLNTHERYIAMRRARQQLRERDVEVTGTGLAAYLDAGGPGRLTDRADLTMLVAQLGNIARVGCERWLASSTDQERARNADWVSEFLDEPVTLETVDRILLAVNG